MKNIFSVLSSLAQFQCVSIRLLRISIAIVLCWIGGLKYFAYEAEGIVPFVAHSPLMNFFYTHGDQYKAHEVKEGELNKNDVAWNQSNHTYLFADVLGLVIVSLGLLLILNRYSLPAGMIGASLVIVMSFTTLSFLITTPEAWVRDFSRNYYGFPLLSGRGRLIVKDLIMGTGAFACLCDSAKMYLIRKKLADAVPGISCIDDACLVS